MWEAGGIFGNRVLSGLSGKRIFYIGKGFVFLSMKRNCGNLYISLNFHNKREYAGFYVSEMERVCGDEIRTWNRDVIIPIPMYKRKRDKGDTIRQKYWQNVLGKGFRSRLIQKASCVYGKTIPQKSLGRKEREINLKNAFKTSDKCVRIKESTACG